MEERMIISVKSIKNKEIEFIVNSDIEEFLVFESEKNTIIDKNNYEIKRVEQGYILNIKIDSDFYFYGIKDGVTTNYMYFFKNNIVLGNEFIYKEFIVPKEGIKEGVFNRFFFNEKELKAPLDNVRMNRDIDIEKSYFKVEGSDFEKMDISIYLYALDKENLKVKVTKVR